MTCQIGYNFSQVYTSAELATLGKGFGLGDRTTDATGNEWMFVQAAAAITQYDTVHVSAVFQANAITGALADDVGVIAFASSAAFTTGDYGWVMARGRPTIRVAASCAASAQLYTTDTAGVLDDAINTASQTPLIGVVCATAGTAGGVTNVLAVAVAPMHGNIIIGGIV